ncbi:MAG: M20/M25/M40 family metallo-hydrolase, partial [Methylobacter sp.]|nr:M20/M25/M40 family metallo-hydrolase [Methylobacter sp.]
MLKKQLLSEKPHLTVAVGVIIVILALIITGLFHATPPAPLLASVSPSIFSSARAMSTVRHIAQKPHPTGTSENAKVRNYLVAELKALGLEPHIQTALGINKSAQEPSVGVVHNVLVRVPGLVSGKALLLMAHYDSTHTGPGAADDGASVAAILETLRALKTLPRLQNDLICIFTDGEEAGLLGAEAFVAEHPWAKQIGLVLNFEYRGNRGPFVMFETSQGNGKLINGFAKAAPLPLGNSLMYEVYKRLPNDTDMTVFKRAGIPGMNFAAIEGHTSYHTQLDRPELLQEGSLQHQGEILLALAQHFGNAPLDNLRSADSVYFDAPGLGLVNYSVSWVLPLSGALILLFAIVLVLGLKSGELRAARTTLGALAFLIMIPALAGICQLLWIGIRRLHPEYDSLLQGDTYNSHWYLLAFV